MQKVDNIHVDLFRYFQFSGPCQSTLDMHAESHLYLQYSFKSVKHLTKVPNYRVASNNKIARFYFILQRFHSPFSRDKKTMQWMQIHTFEILFGEHKYWIQLM